MTEAIKKKASRCFEDGTQLPPHVYRSNRWNSGDKSYRYKLPNGKFIAIPSDNKDQIIKMAEEANSAAKAKKERKTYKEVQASLRKKERDAKRKAEVEYVSDCKVENHYNRFIEIYKVSKSTRTPEYVNGQITNSKKHLRPLFNMDVRQLERRDFRPCWAGMTYHAQANLRAILRDFVSFLDDEGLAPLLKKDNPFISVPAGGFAFATRLPKQRGIMTEDTYRKILEQLKTFNRPHIVNAFEIGYFTCLRVSDILNLKLSENIKGNKLLTLISKSKGRSGGKMQYVEYDLNVHTRLREIIKRARLREPIGCDYIISNGGRVSRNYVSFYIRKAINNLPEYASTPMMKRPTFHELRALRVNVDKAEDRPIEEISKDLAHTDAKITKQKYDTHENYTIHQVEYEPRQL